MNRKLIVKIIGTILCIEAACMLCPLLVSLTSRSADVYAFVGAIAACLAVGLPLRLLPKADRTRLQTRDGFVCVALCWIFLSLFGALPYFFAGVS